MNGLQQYLITKDKEMKKTTNRVNKAMRETVDVEGLADKILGKYLKFIQTKVASPGPHINTLKNPVVPNPVTTEEQDQ